MLKTFGETTHLLQIILNLQKIMRKWSNKELQYHDRPSHRRTNNDHHNHHGKSNLPIDDSLRNKNVDHYSITTKQRPKDKLVERKTPLILNLCENHRKCFNLVSENVERVS